MEIINLRLKRHDGKQRKALVIFYPFKNFNIERVICYEQF